MTRRREGWKLRKNKGSPYWYVLFTHDGHRVHRSTECVLKPEAAKRAEEIYVSVVSTTAPDPSPSLTPPTLPEEHALDGLFSRWLSVVKETRSSQWHETLSLYVSAHWLSRWKLLAEITSASVQLYIGQRLRAPGQNGEHVSSVTLAKELCGLRQFLKWCRERRYLTELPLWRAPKPVSDHKPIYLNRDEMLKVLAELPRSSPRGKRHPLRAYFTLMWATSFRRGTLSRLRWDDSDLDLGTVAVRASADKKRKARVVPLTTAAIGELKQIGPGVGLVFGKRDYRVSLRSAARRAGIAPEKAERISNHSIRHSRLTDLATHSKNIAGVQYMAGHSDLGSTMRYIHGSLENAKALLEEVEHNAHIARSSFDQDGKTEEGGGEPAETKEGTGD